MSDNRFVVYHNRKPAYVLSQTLAERQGCTDQEIINLVDLHQHKLTIFDTMCATDDRTKLRVLAEQVEQLEFEMQKNWHFPQDPNFREWYRVPKCTCPKMDNADYRGTDYRIYDSECPIHGER